MRRTITLILLTLLLSATAVAQHPVSYTAADSLTVCRLLQQASQQPSTTCLPLFLARQFLGCPYVAHTLEGFPTDERLVVNTRQLDCTTLVETVVALTQCAKAGQTSFADYTRRLTSLRYRQGVIDGYPSRLHYFSDWIADNQRRGNVVETQQPNPPFTRVQTVSVGYMSAHPQAYASLSARPAYIPEIRRQEQALSGTQARYIPKAQVVNSRAMRAAVADGDIIAIVTDKAGLDIAHLGFAVWRADGLHLLNASSLHKQVVEEPMTLRRYLQKHPSFTGIRVIKINY